MHWYLYGHIDEPSCFPRGLQVASNAHDTKLAVTGAFDMRPMHGSDTFRTRFFCFWVYLLEFALNVTASCCAVPCRPVLMWAYPCLYNIDGELSVRGTILAGHVAEHLLLSRRLPICKVESMPVESMPKTLIIPQKMLGSSLLFMEVPRSKFSRLAGSTWPLTLELWGDAKMATCKGHLPLGGQIPHDK